MRLHVAAGAIGVALLAGLAITLWPRKPSREPPPVIGAVPDFQLVDQTGARFDSVTRLRGRAWVANFIFTRCTTVCPIFTARMKGLEERTRAFGDRLNFVSFSVDPEYDRPEVLARYAAAQHAVSPRWWFLTGRTDAVTATVVKALKIAMEKQPDKPVGESILHGTHFVLVDRHMNIRGYYNLSDVDAVDRIQADLARIE